MTIVSINMKLLSSSDAGNCKHRHWMIECIQILSTGFNATMAKGLNSNDEFQYLQCKRFFIAKSDQSSWDINCGSVALMAAQIAAMMERTAIPFPAISCNTSDSKGAKIPMDIQDSEGRCYIYLYTWKDCRIDVQGAASGTISISKQWIGIRKQTSRPKRYRW